MTDEKNTQTSDAKNSQSQTFKVSGEELLKKVKELIHEGNIRQISILDKNDKVIVTFPLTIGVVGAVLVPVLAAVGTIAALVSECTIKVDRN